MRHKEEKILMGEEHLLRRGKSWRRARVGAIALFFIFIVAAIPIYGDDTISKEERSNALNLIVIGCVFWLLIIEWLTLHIRRIDSIKLHRKIEESQSGSDTDNGKMKD
jgi:NADH:ubiquinone oxidoreductase subunit 6 (subunit J)